MRLRAGRAMVRWAAIAGLCATSLLSSAQARERPVVVFAAASLKNALDDVNVSWARESGQKATLVFAGSNVLARQIDAGAPADIFISADLDWMNDIASKGLVRSESRVDLLGNTLVLIAPKDTPVSPTDGALLRLSARLGQGRLAMANVDAVPAGKYGRAALAALGEWESVKDRVAQAESVRAALVLVSRGEAPFGIVYGSDAASDPGVKVVFTFAPETYPAIVYPAALMASSQNARAPAFLAFLRSKTARPLFETHGLTVLDRAAPPS